MARIHLLPDSEAGRGPLKSRPIRSQGNAAGGRGLRHPNSLLLDHLNCWQEWHVDTYFVISLTIPDQKNRCLALAMILAAPRCAPWGASCSSLMTSFTWVWGTTISQGFPEVDGFFL